jgi:hypothetical protein
VPGRRPNDPRSQRPRLRDREVYVHYTAGAARHLRSRADYTGPIFHPQASRSPPTLAFQTRSLVVSRRVARPCHGRSCHLQRDFQARAFCQNFPHFVTMTRGRTDVSTSPVVPLGGVMPRAGGTARTRATVVYGPHEELRPWVLRGFAQIVPTVVQRLLNPGPSTGSPALRSRLDALLRGTIRTCPLESIVLRWWMSHCPVCRVVPPGTCRG